MLDWDKLRVFYMVAKCRNLTKAAQELGINQSSVSRQIATLEERLGISLFHRRPRGMLLTEQGEMLLSTVAEFFQKLSATENALLEVDVRPKGELKVTVPVAIGTVWLVPTIKEFMKLYPEVRLTLIVEDRELDLSMREADVAIRFYPSKQPDLVQRPLFSIQNSLYASNDYLHKRGTPRTLKDLQEHDMIAYTDGVHPPYENVNWLFRRAHKQGILLQPQLSVNSLYGILRAVKSGMGIAALPDYMVERARRISRILDELKGPTVESYFVYPADLRKSKRVRAFYSFMQRKVADYNF